MAASIFRLPSMRIVSFLCSRVHSGAPRCCPHSNTLPMVSVIHNRSFSKEPEMKPPSKVKRGLMLRYYGYVERVLKKRSPRAYRLFLLIKDGMWEFYQDFKTYTSVSRRLWEGETLDKFTMEELENFKQMPSDVFKVAPVLLISAAPFMNYVVFPIAFYFPRHLLSQHFWTAEQKMEFSQHYLLHKRIPHIPKVLRYMAKHTGDIHDLGRRKVFEDILSTLENREVPDTAALLDIQPLFVDRPFGLDYIMQRHPIHKYHIAKSLGFSQRMTPLAKDTLLLHHIDIAMDKEGVHTLNLHQAQQASFQRGLDATGLEKEELLRFLTRWTELSKATPKTSLSFLLHFPVFLSMNQPNNVKHINLEHYL